MRLEKRGRVIRRTGLRHGNPAQDDPGPGGDTDLPDPNIDAEPLAKFLLDSRLCRLSLHIQVGADECDDHHEEEAKADKRGCAAQFLHRVSVPSRYRKESTADS